MTYLLARQWLLIAALVAMFFVATPAMAQTEVAPTYDAPSPSAAAMAFDVVVVRPLSFASTVVGSALFLVVLPFAALGHNTHQAAEKLVVDPARYTFARPIGDFDNDATPN